MSICYFLADQSFFGSISINLVKSTFSRVNFRRFMNPANYIPNSFITTTRGKLTIRKVFPLDFALYAEI